ncbi:MAG: BlaI/MecI/CopY family transcriptional regulator [Phycisphaerae bacterium]|nr:BlaI/MecI/CopY family transcriptional regulator [Phycisphaerae bacterium]
MARPRSKHPTEHELEILKILWRDGPANVRSVREALSARRDLAYTSVMTVMNIMTNKGLLKRTKQGGSFVYQPRVTEQATTRRMLGDLVDRLFDGSATLAVSRLIETSDIDDAEIGELRSLLKEKAGEKPS